MTGSIGQYFEKFIKKIKPTQNELERARRRRDHALGVLRNLDIGILEVINSGSYAKHTSIRPLTDLDVFVYISKSQYPMNRYDRVLHTIAKGIRPSFPQNDVEVGNRSVKIKYSDGFSIDIVPAFSTSKQELEPAEIIDRNSEKWILTAPKKHLEFVKEFKRKEPRFNEFVRMLKTWKSSKRRKYRSFFISLLVADAIAPRLPGNWDEAVYTIFDRVMEHMLEKKICFNSFYPCPKQMPSDPVVVLDPANPKNNVADDFDSGKKQEFLNLWSKSWKHAKKAVEASTMSEAVRQWKIVFPEFPSRP